MERVSRGFQVSPVSRVWNRNAARQPKCVALLAWSALWCLSVALGCGAEEPSRPQGPPREGYSAVATRPEAVAAASGEEAFPGDVPGYPGASFYMGGTDERERRFISLSSRAAYTDVYTYYRRALIALGWDIEQDTQRGRSFMLVASKPGRSLSVRVASARQGSEITLETGPVVVSGDS